MKRFLFIGIIITCSVQALCQKKISGYYGGDLRVRAGSGLIFENALQDYDFETSELKNIALIYWPDNELGDTKTGLTIFENRSQVSVTMDAFNAYADSVVTASFSNLQKIKFTRIAITPPQLKTYFYRYGLPSPIMATDSGKSFLANLESLGYDGMLLLKEDKMSDLIFGSRTGIPSKGVYSYYKDSIVYHGLHSFLIDTKTKKRVKRIGYLQVSGELFSKATAADQSIQDIILTNLKTRFQNNIDEFIRVHKLY